MFHHEGHEDREVKKFKCEIFFSFVRFADLNNFVTGGVIHNRD